MVLKNQYCEKCGEEFTDIDDKWCKPCQINYLKKNFINWASGNEVIDNFIQEMQLEINYSGNVIVEWIPYNQFDNIKEIVKDEFHKISSAIWENGPLNYDKYKMTYKRNLRDRNKLVYLKCFNSQNNIVEYFNKV